MMKGMDIGAGGEMHICAGEEVINMCRRESTFCISEGWRVYYRCRFQIMKGGSRNYNFIFTLICVE